MFCISAWFDYLYNLVNGNWTVWDNWSTCSVSCGTGMTSRHRDCTNPKPGNGGEYCTGEQNQYNVCFVKACAGKHRNMLQYIREIEIIFK